MRKLSLSFIITLNSIITFGQCDFSVKELLKIGEMNGSQIEDFTLLKGMSTFEENAYFCDNQKGMLFLERKDDEFSYKFGTYEKNLYQSWKTYVNNSPSFEYFDEVLEDGQRLFVYKYNTPFTDQSILGVAVNFTQKYTESGDWLGVITIAYFY